VAFDRTFRTSAVVNGIATMHHTNVDIYVYKTDKLAAGAYSQFRMFCKEKDLEVTKVASEQNSELHERTKRSRITNLPVTLARTSQSVFQICGFLSVFSSLTFSTLLLPAGRRHQIAVTAGLQ